MAIIKKKQLNEMSNDDLKKRMHELKLELSKERAQIAIGGSPTNSGRVREIRKSIARMFTKLNKKEVVNG